MNETFVYHIRHIYSETKKKPPKRFQKLFQEVAEWHAKSDLAQFPIRFVVICIAMRKTVQSPFAWSLSKAIVAFLHSSVFSCSGPTTTSIRSLHTPHTYVRDYKIKQSAGRIAGNIRRGRPRRRWTDDIKQRITDVPVAECVQRARDRSVWRSIPGVRVRDLRFSDMGEDQGNARQGEV